MRRTAIIAASLLALASGAARADAGAPTRSRDAGLLIEGVTVVDPRDGSRAPNRSIYVKAGKVARVGPAGSFRAPAGALRIPAKGKFVVPGFLDMHAHPLDPADARTSLPLMVAYGVTGYRQMGGSPELLAQRRAGRLPSGTVPELLEMPGRVMAGPPAELTPAAAVDIVRRQKADGADFIKVVDLAPDSFFAALEAAHASGLKFSGHLPPSVDIREAVGRGMDSIEHLGPNTSLLMACSTEEADLRAEARKAAASAPPKIRFDLPQAQLKRLTANPVLLGGSSSITAFRRVLDTYDEAKCRELAATLAAAKTWQAPTLIRLRSMELGNDPSFRNDPNLRYIPAGDRQIWLDAGDDFEKRFTPEERATLRELFARQLKVTKLLDDAGVKMLAGSDYGGIWLVAGASLHQEFDLLAQAGLSPLKVLQMTTINGARFLHREGSMGAVEQGKDANVVLLDDDPLASVANLHKIHGVVLRGAYLTKDDLARLKEAAAADIAKRPS